MRISCMRTGDTTTTTTTNDNNNNNNNNNNKTSLSESRKNWYRSMLVMPPLKWALTSAARAAPPIPLPLPPPTRLWTAANSSSPNIRLHADTCHLTWRVSGSRISKAVGSLCSHAPVRRSEDLLYYIYVYVHVCIYIYIHTYTYKHTNIQYIYIYIYIYACRERYRVSCYIRLYHITV